MTKNPTLLNYYFVGCGPKIQLTDKNDDTITSDTNKGLKQVHRSVGGIDKLQQIHSFCVTSSTSVQSNIMQQFGKSANAPGADTLFLNLEGTFDVKSSNTNLCNS